MLAVVRELHGPLRGNPDLPPNPLALMFLSGCFSMAGVGNGFTEQYPCHIRSGNSPNAFLPLMERGNTIYDGVPGTPPAQFFPETGVPFRRMFSKLPATFDSSIKHYQQCPSDPVSTMSELQQDIHDYLRFTRTVKLTLTTPIVTFSTRFVASIFESGNVIFSTHSSVDELCEAVGQKFGQSWRLHVNSVLPPKDQLPKAKKSRCEFFS